MDDLALIVSHHNKGETSRKQLHKEEDEKANSLACIISFNNNFENSLLIPKEEANNTISFSNNNNIIGAAKFGERRSGEQAHEHLLAERKRRKKMSKLFVSLASLVPGLNRMDKASILEGAATLIRQLGERAKQDDHQSTIDMMKKSSLLPEVEVKSLEKELLITILLYKNQQKGNIDEILSVIQRLHLTIKTTNFMPFGTTSMHITVIAQMNDEFCETTDFLAEKLRSSIINV